MFIHEALPSTVRPRRSRALPSPRPRLQAIDLGLLGNAIELPQDMSILEREVARTASAFARQHAEIRRRCVSADVEVRQGTRPRAASLAVQRKSPRRQRGTRPWQRAAQAVVHVEHGVGNRK